MSKKQIKNILEDIYKIDKSLKNYGSQLEKIVIEILNAKPEVSIDKEFKKELYQEIMARVSELKPKKTAWNFVNLFKSWQVYAFSAVAVIIILAAVVVFPGGGKVNFNLGINDIKDSGFGPLALSDSSSPEARGVGGGGAPGAKGTLGLPAPGYAEPGYTEFKYVYIGDNFSIDEDTAWVYKRKVDSSASKAFARKISDLKFDLVNFSKFKDLSVDQITISEDRDFGYSINLDFKNAYFGVYKNWQKWPIEEKIEEKINVSDIPSDEEIIAIADAFLDKYNIDMSAYSDGKISEYWKTMLGQVKSDKQNEQTISISREIAVMYQLFLDNVRVYDEWGNEVGINAEINVLNKKLSNLSNITAQSYDRSKYTLETNVDRILEFAGKGGVSGFFSRRDPIKIVEIQLDIPEKIFVQALIFNDNKSEHEILYVPALSFPIVDSGETGLFYGRKRIIVPLVKEVLDQKMEEEEIDNRILPEPAGGQ